MKLRTKMLLMVLLAIAAKGSSQDSMSSVTKEKSSDFKISGGISLGGEIYNVNGIDARRSPYSYNISGRVALSYKGFTIPISGSYRDAQFSYDYTFNRLGIAPSYKWAKVYLGWNTMSFSPYTMAGRSFYGVGFELKPGLFTISGLKGKIQNPLAIRDTLIDGASLIPTYDRYVQGGKLGFGKDRSKIEFIFLQIKDDENSFQYDKSYTTSYGYQQLTPRENILLGINGGLTLFKKIDFFINTGFSGFTADQRDTLYLNYGDAAPDVAYDIFKANSSSSFSLAGDGGVNIRIGTGKLGLKYRRVDPFYTTLASNYFVNDVQQYTFTGGVGLWQRKIRVDGQFGIEENNLTGKRTNTTERIIGNANLNFYPSDKFYATLTFSNFQTSSENQVLQLDDTLRFVSISNQYGLSTSYMPVFTNKTMTINLSAFYNTVSDQSEIQQVGDIKILSLNLSNNVGIKALDLTVGGSLNFNQYDYSNKQQNRYGFGLRMTKRFLEKKLSINGSANFSINEYDGLSDGQNQTYQMSVSYKTSKKSTLSFNLSHRIVESLVNNSFDESRGLMRYGLNF